RSFDQARSPHGDALVDAPGKSPFALAQAAGKAPRQGGAGRAACRVFLDAVSRREHARIEAAAWSALAGKEIQAGRPGAREVLRPRRAIERSAAAAAARVGTSGGLSTSFSSTRRANGARPPSSTATGPIPSSSTIVPESKELRAARTAAVPTVG